MLKDKTIAVTPNNGSHFTTLKMMEGFVEPKHVKTTNAGSMLKRLEAVRDGKVAAASLMEPWISVAQKWGLRILIESHSTRAEAAGDDLDGPTLAAMFRAQARAVKVLAKDPKPYIHYLIAETGGLLEPHELQTWRLLHAPTQPYTRERFDDTYNWTVKWNMTVPSATFENTVIQPLARLEVGDPLTGAAHGGACGKPDRHLARHLQLSARPGVGVVRGNAHRDGKLGQRYHP